MCCFSPQSERHPGLPAKAAADRPVLSHADPGAGEAGEGGAEEPCTHHRQGEGRVRHRQPEDPRQTLQLLHCNYYT